MLFSLPGDGRPVANSLSLAVSAVHHGVQLVVVLGLRFDVQG